MYSEHAVAGIRMRCQQNPTKVCRETCLSAHVPNVMYSRRSVGFFMKDPPTKNWFRPIFQLDSKSAVSRSKTPVGVEPTSNRFAGGCHAVWRQRRFICRSNVLARSRTWPSTFAGSRANSATLRGQLYKGSLAPRRGIEPRLAVSRTAVRSGTLARRSLPNTPTWS